jgi:hypothetical protein
LLLVTMPPQTLGAAGFRAHLDAVTAFYQRGRIGIVMDVRSGHMITAAERRIVANRFDEDMQRYPDCLACFGLVHHSAMQRGIFKAISWMTNAPFAREAFASLEPAMEWARDCIRAPVVARLKAR